MQKATSSGQNESPQVIVIGAGIAGLATTLRLAKIGLRVTLLERHGHIGGKNWTVPSKAGPIDAGPATLTLRHVFDDLFANAGERLEDHVELIRQSTIARHFWPDGSQLDLYDDPDASVEAIRAFSGDKSAKEFVAFSKRARELFEAFQIPMIHTAAPNLNSVSAHLMRNRALIPLMAPFSTLKILLHSSFSDPRLRQLFGRHAVSLGGAPGHAHSLLALTWHTEAAGTWAVKGGVHKLAEAIAKLATKFGADIQTGAHVERVDHGVGGQYRVQLAGGRNLPCNVLVYAGDPRALADGALGLGFRSCAVHTLGTPRSFSARVHSFAATPKGPELARHNIFFSDDPDGEFTDLMADRLPKDPSIDVYALDRGLGFPPPALERFKIFSNAPAQSAELEATKHWHPKILKMMARFDLSFDPTPDHLTVTSEVDFAEMFPGSLGALYGQSPHGLLSSFKRPTARTHLPGVYLAGGGCHPGAGLPMVATSGQRAAEAILNDRIFAKSYA